jgi:ligand-binding SRPBCC domain-containing protein
MTEIGHVERHKLFVDEQKKGPYALWHHEHHFKPIEGGVEMTDIVHYKIPFGPIGVLGTPIVKAQLNKIFSYRRKKVEELFGTMDS